MVNFCKRDTLSYCDKANSPKKQKQCQHYRKATHFSRCMFLFDSYCTCLEAQIHEERLLSDLEIAEMEEFEESKIIG